jgi:hypothetical protein
VTYKVATLKTDPARVMRAGGPADPGTFELVYGPDGLALREDGPAGPGTGPYVTQPARDWWDALDPADAASLDLWDVENPPAPGAVWDPVAHDFVDPPVDPAPFGWVITRTSFRKRIPFPVWAKARQLAARIADPDPAVSGVAAMLAELLARVEERATITTNDPDVIGGAAVLSGIPDIVAAGFTAGVADAMTAPATPEEVPSGGI